MSYRQRRGSFSLPAEFDYYSSPSQLPYSISPLATLASSSSSTSTPFTARGPLVLASDDPMSGSDSGSSGSLSPTYVGLAGSESDLSRAHSQRQAPLPNRSSPMSWTHGSAVSEASASIWSSAIEQQRPGHAPGPPQSRSPSGRGTADPQQQERSRRRQNAFQQSTAPNANAHLLRQARETGSYGPTSLPPRSYSGQSPFEPPKATPPKVFQYVVSLDMVLASREAQNILLSSFKRSQMEYLDNVSRRVDAVEQGAQDVVRQRGERAIQNASTWLIHSLSSLEAVG